MQSESRYVITALPFPRFAQIHIKLRYVFEVWHLRTFSEEEMRVGLFNINAGPDAWVAAGIYLNPLQQCPLASRRSTSGSLEALKDYIGAEPRLDQYTPRGWRQGLRQREEREKWLCPLSERAGRERGRWMGCGVRLGKHSPLFASLFPFFSQGQTENQASCSCLSVCVRGGNVDLCGLYISRRESPPTNLPLGPLATGPHHYSLEIRRQRHGPLPPTSH